MTKKISDLPLATELNRGDLIPFIKNNITSVFPFNGRIPVTSDLTLYVSPSGNNNNDGLTPSTPFQTIQRAFDIGSTLYDLGSNSLIIQLADGTYSGTGLGFNVPEIQSSATIFSSKLILRGNIANPQNVLLNKSSGTTSVIYCGVGSNIFIEGVSLENNNGAAIAVAGGFVQFANIRIGTCSSSQLIVGRGGVMEVRGNYEVYGDGPRHIFIYERQGGCQFDAANYTCTLTGNPNFWWTFVQVRGPNTVGINLTFSGSATGVRYRIDRRATLDVNGAGINYLPGNSAGVITNNAIYA